MENILTELRKPFHPSQIEWKPGSLSGDKTRALAIAYADVRAYQNRLDEVCGMSWAVSYSPWGDRIVCHLTIDGVTRSSTGEPDSQSERSEIAGTASEAQAFKRACAMFGLGRYLYNLPSLWVDYDAGARGFADKARAKLDMVINQHYRRVMGGETEAQPEQNEDATETLRHQFDELGKELYGDQWEHVSRHNTERVSNGQVSDVGQLTAEQVQKLVDGLKSLKRKRQSVASRQKQEA